MSYLTAAEKERKALRAMLDVARAEIRQLSELIRTYGDHNSGCNGPFPPHRCKCGWSEAAKKLRETD